MAPGSEPIVDGTGVVHQPVAFQSGRNPQAHLTTGLERIQRVVLAASLISMATIGCDARPWSVRLQNFQTSSVVVRVDVAGSSSAYLVGPQDSEILWIGRGPSEMGVSVLSRDCVRLAGLSFTSERYTLLLFGPDEEIARSNEDAGVGPDPHVAEPVDLCPGS